MVEFETDGKCEGQNACGLPATQSYCVKEEDFKSAVLI